MLTDQTTISISASEAEDCLLGSILIESCRGDNEAIRKVSNILQPWDFKGCSQSDKPAYWATNPKIYYAMLKCDLPPHIIAVSRKLVELDLLDIKHPAYMRHLEYSVPCSLDYLHYARAVKEYSLQRQVKYHAEKGNFGRINELTKVTGRKGFEI